MKEKMRVGVIFGGRSGEHEVSLVSATSVISSLDKKKYDVAPIGIAKDGRWFEGDGVMEAFKTGKAPSPDHEVSILPDPSHKGIYFLHSNKLIPLDVVFPVLHGTFGEDGTIQGLFELAGLPYVGAGVLGSGVGMDKIIQKELAQNAGISIAPFVWFLAREYGQNRDAILKNIEAKLSYPCFVKPSNSGSSVGIAKAHDRKELEAAITDAARYDRRIIVEKGIENAREIEVGVLGNDEPIASCPGEVISSNEFYDYDAKYVDGKTKTIAPADLSERIAKQIQDTAIRAYKLIDCCGMARVDFLIQKDNIFLSELNTIPGFTSISMYPKLWEKSGLPYPKLLDKLIDLALERNREKNTLLTTYQPKGEWYK